MDFFEGLARYMQRQAERPSEELLREMLTGREAMPETRIKPKSLKDSQNLLRLSETTYKDEPYIVLKAHSDGLSFAPKNSPIAGTHYARRVLILQKLKLFKEALQDIELALEHPIAKETKNDLLSRRDIIKGLLEETSKTNVAEEKVVLSYGENDSISGASSAITFANNEVDGRHLIAAQPIKINDVLMIQKPYAYLSTQDPEDPLLFEDPSFVCNDCLHPSLAPIPCDGCIRATYCSKKCRSEAYDKYHKLECTLPSTSDVNYNFGLRLFAIMTQQGENVKEVLNLVKELPNNPGDVQTTKFEANDVGTVLNLPNKMDSTKNIVITCSAGSLALEVKKKTNILRNQNPFHFAKFLLRLMFIAKENSFEIKRGKFNDTVAIALYPLLNQMKLSDTPNTTIHNDENNNKIVRASRNIEAGEKIFYNH